MGLESVIPVITFSDELKPGTTEWDSVRARVRQALQEYGCFEALFDKIPSELRKSMMGATREMLDIPMEKKTAVTSDNEPFGTGYTGKSSRASWETMGIEDVIIPENVTRFTNRLWPEGNTGNPSFDKTVGVFSEKVAELDQMIRRMVLESFGIEKYYDEHIDKSRYGLRAMKYEASENVLLENMDSNEVVLIPHTDKNILTILCQTGEIDGLEVQTKDGKWINVNPSPDSFVVMLGDSFHAWTNGHLQAPIHRVVMPLHETRYSVGLFSNPKAGYIIKAPDELVDEEHPVRFKPFDYKEYLNFFATKKGYTSHQSGIKVFCGV
ncbi:2-oxoglutarate-dependent dioxygenase AOP2-like [Cornus florida]|uniref:2-oxoglutarate-dependent dioxygenase AOP2-like n=1 Tax=Cornus florida TaxID=4283 RepID=UPI00289B4E1B|nr:2-oxoglutarate-dependent dioxygenase AOP2-like [Cornus florida]